MWRCTQLGRCCRQRTHRRLMFNRNRCMDMTSTTMQVCLFSTTWGSSSNAVALQGNVLKGRPIAERMRLSMQQEVQHMVEFAPEFRPRLCVVQVGRRSDSNLYIRMKRKFAESVGVQFELREFPETVQQEELMSVVDSINNDASVHGAIIQLPLPDHLDGHVVYDHLSPVKDVDGFHSTNLTYLARNRDERSTCFVPCTALACYRLLSEVGIDPSGKHAVVLGRSNIAGLPTAYMLRKLHCSTTVLHSRSVNLAKHVAMADIVVSAVGKPNLVHGDWIKPGAVVIDIGISVLGEEEIGNEKKLKKVTGDVDFEVAREHASAITPVPGGVGPVTVACLIENTVLAAKRQLIEAYAQDSGQDVQNLPFRVTNFAFHSWTQPPGISESWYGQST